MHLLLPYDLVAELLDTAQTRVTLQEMTDIARTELQRVEAKVSRLQGQIFGAASSATSIALESSLSTTRAEARDAR